MDMFRISDGKIVEHWGHADDPTYFLRERVLLSLRETSFHDLL